jgi:alcohol dehydrogenase
MKAVFIRRFGDNRVVEYGDRPDPQPGPGDLLVKVHAASVNPLDFKIRAGKVKAMIRYPLPLVLGNDLSGEVIAVGPQVTRFRVGDEIFARLDKQRIGAFAELALVSEASAAPKPPRLTHVEAASVPLVGLTSWQALVEIGGVTRGSKVLIHAGAGGIGTMAIQMAHHLGAWVATTTSARHEARMRALGADEVVDYRTQRFEDRLRDTDVDFVLDTLGGDTLLRSFRVVSRGGIVVSIASLPSAVFARRWGMATPLVWVLALLGWKITRAARRAGARFEYLFMRPDGPQLAELGALLERGVLQPQVGRTFPLDQAADALAFVESGRAEGKVVIEVMAPSVADARSAELRRGRGEREQAL